LSLPADVSGARAAKMSLVSPHDNLWSPNDRAALGLTKLERHNTTEAETQDFKLGPEHFAKNPRLVQSIAHEVATQIKSQGRDGQPSLHDTYRAPEIRDGAALYDGTTGKLQGLWVQMSLARKDGGPSLGAEALLKANGEIVRVGLRGGPATVARHDDFGDF
jgi:hypothetical protein